jgi:hypothetical protein
MMRRALRLVATCFNYLGRRQSENKKAIPPRTKLLVFFFFFRFNFNLASVGEAQGEAPSAKHPIAK